MEERKLELNTRVFADRCRDAYKRATKGLLPKTILALVLLALVTAWGLTFAYSVYVQKSLVDVKWFCLYVAGIAIAIYGFKALMKRIFKYYEVRASIRENCDNIIYNGMGNYKFTKEYIEFTGINSGFTKVPYGDIKRIVIWDELMGIVLKDCMLDYFKQGIRFSDYKDADPDDIYEFLKDKGIEVVRLKDSAEGEEAWGSEGEKAEPKEEGVAEETAEEVIEEEVKSSEEAIDEAAEESEEDEEK